MVDYVILVDKKDQQIGIEEKMDAHKSGKLHRAFSVLLFNKAGELLLQRRALDKYHSPGLWTNTCCSHPRPGENIQQAAKRRLIEELGIQCSFKKIFDFIYKTTFDYGLIEHELDHVLVGEFEGEIKPNPSEVMEIRWQSLGDLYEEIKSYPDRFTIWFQIMIEKIAQHEKPLFPAHAQLIDS
ncbi:MAG: isopentenyl-diphosphate Delta-isomerase [Calditrichaeota bacterium]|nr:MAG: isopentenyl-diphosphate Delta-isomerase [Calditrichota bacterium]